MCKPFEILNGAFTAELVKGKWEYKPNLSKIGKRPPYKGSEKEKPQFAFILKAEREAVSSYNEILKQTTLEITKFLKDAINKQPANQS